jgi:hypothetical protein
VFATDATDRTTTSTSFADASISVTITPTRASSTLIVQWVGSGRCFRGVNASNDGQVQITDSSDVALSGAESQVLAYKPGASSQTGQDAAIVVGVVAATNTASRTYKLRFKVATSADSGNAVIKNADNTGRMTVWEVAG